MSPNDIEEYILKNYEGVIPKQSWGETSFFYNPNNILPNGIYFCTIKEQDGANDKASKLNREGIFRFSLGISKQSFINLFETKPKRPSKGGIIEGNYNFEQLDSLTPHPIYGWMGWICILNPSKEGCNDIKDFIDESYNLVLKKFEKKKF
jgi:hypothetical protein